MPLTNDAILLRLSRYIRAMGLSPDMEKEFFHHTEEVLENFSGPDDARRKYHATLPFLRSLAKTHGAGPSLRKLYPLRMARASMVYREGDRQSLPEVLHWERLARWRRVIQFLVLASVFSFCCKEAALLFSETPLALKVPMTVGFSCLFTWIVWNFIIVISGFWLLLRGKDPLNPSRVLQDARIQIAADTKIAVLLPIYQEDVNQVFAGLRAMYESLQATHQADAFTFFILSDTTDPDLWIHEEAAWWAFCEEYQAHGKVIYRHRKSRVRRKSGNVADFCRRWGASFKYMIVLDSDSLMAGRTMVQLARIMEGRPDIGILQTAPQNFNAKTPLALVQQFTSQAYGAIFSRGLHYWQLGDSSYWGHNAILRMDPFMKHCALPPAKGKPPFGGMILSHDSIEAALMRRAGWGVWLAYDLDGSFEQSPSTLTGELKRDQRWCRGNLQHLRLVALKNITLGHRWLFVSGNLFYGASFLWMAVLGLVVTDSISRTLRSPHFFPATMALHPYWPVEHVGVAWLLLSVTIIALFSPKLLTLIMIALNPKDRQRFGGFVRLLGSTGIETLCSFLLAPLRMIWHGYYIMASLLARHLEWNIPTRSATGLSVRESLQLGGVATVVGLVASIYFYHFDRMLFWWISMVSIPLALSIPIAVGMSSGKWGALWMKKGLLPVPTEVAPSPEINRYRTYFRLGIYTKQDQWSRNGFIHAVLNPKILFLHLQMLRKKGNLRRSIQFKRIAIANKALLKGPQALTSQEKRQILYDPALLSFLHEEVWSLPDQAFARWLSLGVTIPPPKVSLSLI